MSSIVQDFSPIIYYSSQVSFTTMPFSKCMLSIWEKFIFIRIRVTCKVHKSVRRDDNYIREPCHPFYRGDIYLQETILWGFHPCLETFGRDGKKNGPNSVASSFRTLGWSSSGPIAFEGFKPLRSLVTPSFETTMSSMKGADLLRNGTSIWSLLLNTSVNWPLNSSACSVSEAVLWYQFLLFL